MSKRKGLAFGGIVLTAWFGAASAQEQPFPVLPTEVFLCNYAEGAGMDDLDALNDDFNEWADTNDLDSVTSLVLTPVFYSDELGYEVIGMDIWQSGAAMGGGITQMMAPGSGLPDYTEVADCGAHQMFALVGIKPPPEGEAPESVVFEFANCTVKDNRTMDDGIGAVAAVTELWADWNVDDAHAVLIPVAGETSDADYSFKWLTSYPSWEAYGAVFDHFASGAVAQTEQILGNVMDCDSSRIYNASIIRQSAAE